MKIQDYINRMTLAEKCSLLSGGTQFTTKAIAHLGIPAIRFSDGPSGLRRQEGAADHLGLHSSVPATCWPSAATVANSWDTALAEEIGAALGKEAAAQKVHVLLGPGLNIKRSPLCGRNFEYFSEDPYLSGKMAAGYIRGIQSQGVAACPKHFAVNSQETLRMHSDSVLDERTLREVYLTGFEIAVKEGKPQCIMSSYNRVNGVYANENRHLLRDILVDEWGFDGFVVTDWGGCNDRVAGLLAGSHMEMPTTGGTSDLEVLRAVKEGRVDEQWLDQILSEYLKNCLSVSGRDRENVHFDPERHHALACRAAAESAVLLKNEGHLLPLAAGTRVAVIGEFARVPQYQGSGSSCVNPTQVDCPLTYLENSSLDVIGYAPGYERFGGRNDSAFQDAIALARRAEVVILWLGLDELAETEGMDREDMSLRPCQVELLEALSRENSSIVVVLSGGAPIETPWISCCKSLIHGYLGGQAGAGAMADLLTGNAVPCGKLAESWPMTLEDTPCARYYPGREKTAEYREGIYVGYRYYDTVGKQVRFPFGFGLSYTSFEYADLDVSDTEATFRITNTGDVPGAEIAQLYISIEEPKVFRPIRELKGFAKAFLQPGESKTVSILLDDKAFRYFNSATNRWEREAGSYRIEVGASSRDIRLVKSKVIEGTNAPIPYMPGTLPSYANGRIDAVEEEEFSRLLGYPLPDRRWDRTAPLTVNDTFVQLQYAPSWIGRQIFRLFQHQVDSANSKGKPDLDALFRLSMPFRGIAKMTGGIADMAMTEAVVEIFNGHFFRGCGSFLKAWRRKGREAKAFRKRGDA